MFDFDAGKLIIIGIVALIAIPHKDLPRVLRQLGQAVSKMRRMGAEFQNQFMDAMREAEVTDIKADLAKLKDSANLDLPHFNPVQDLRREMIAAVESNPSIGAPKKLEPLSQTLPAPDEESPKKIAPPETHAGA